MGFCYGFSRNMDIDFTGLSFMIREKKWHILASGLIAIAVLASIFMAIPQEYQGSTSILIENREFVFNGPDKITAQATIIHSDIIVLKAIKKLGLSDDALVDIKQELKISIDKNSRVLQLRFSSNDRRLASMVPNAIAEEYLAASQIKTVNAHVIAHATSVGESGKLENTFYAILSMVLAMALYVTGIIISALISGAGLKPSGKIPRELVPDAVQNLPEFAV